MILTLALLAHGAAATPAPVPTTAPTPVPARKFTGGFGKVATAPASRVVIGPDDVKAAPTPEPEPFIPGMTAKTKAVAATPSPGPQPSATAAAGQNEVAWRMRYQNVRSDLKRAETDMVHARQNAVVSGYVGEASAVEETIKKALSPYQAEVDKAKKAVRLLQDECAATPGCVEAWVRD